MKVFIGYDTREDIAYQVCKHSILSRRPDVEINPLIQKELRDIGLYSRPIDKLSSTEFTFTRFLVPELCNFKGWALFMDCDMILQTDISELFKLADDRYAVMCVQHEYNPKEETKMDGCQQTQYPRKNWSSLMLINCEHPSNQNLTKELINNSQIDGKFLHRFSWLKDEDIGELQPEWNWLVGWYKEPQDGIPKILHYTEGGPWFEKYRHCEYHQEWKTELYNMMNNV
jgi:lipopolysaccharide biosynthesis glycosyltransferase